MARLGQDLDGQDLDIHFLAADADIRADIRMGLWLLSILQQSNKLLVACLVEQKAPAKRDDGKWVSSISFSSIFGAELT